MAPPGSKWPPTLLMLSLYPALIVWLVLMAVCILFGLASWLMEGVCNTEEVRKNQKKRKKWYLIGAKK